MLSFQNFLLCPLLLSPVCIQTAGCYASFFPVNQSLIIINTWIRNINSVCVYSTTVWLINLDMHTVVYGCSFNFWHFFVLGRDFIQKCTFPPNLHAFGSTLTYGTIYDNINMKVTLKRSCLQLNLSTVLKHDNVLEKYNTTFITKIQHF